MAADSDDMTIGELARRMRSVEASMERFSERVDKQFAGLQASIGNLGFVPAALYERDRAATDRAIADTQASLTRAVGRIEATADRAIRVAWGAVALISSGVVGAVIVAVARAAGG